jgi:hypothetical protein
LFSARQISYLWTVFWRFSRLRSVEIGLGFAIKSQAHRRHTAETGSLSYRLVVHFLLLSTSPRGDAATVGYRL